MKSHENTFLLKALSLAIGSMFAVTPAYAEGGDEEIADLTKPESSVSAGIQSASGSSRDRAVFGQYNGMRKQANSLILDIDYVKRDETTGTWTVFNGLNLGLETQELRFSQDRQGDWKYGIEYNEIVRNYSNTINTTLGGIGTNNLMVSPVIAGQRTGMGSDVDLKTKRENLGLGFEKWINNELQFEASFKNEDKTGVRINGRYGPCSAGAGTANNGYGCGNTTSAVLLLLPEPISSSTQQFEAKLNYQGDKLALSGGYYGTFFKNKYGSLNTTLPNTLYYADYGTFNPLATAGNVYSLGNPLALAPDNQSHQISLAGNYAFTPTTKSTFKYAFTRATQHEDFTSMGLGAMAGGVGTSPRTNLGAVWDTTTAQFGITSRPIQKLSLAGNLRYEQRVDTTPIDRYFPQYVPATTANSGKTNGRSSHTKILGKVEASYQLPDNYRITAALEADMRDLGVPLMSNDTSGQAPVVRQKTQELGYRLELRKSMLENLAGTVSYAHSARNGSSWMNTAGAFNTGAYLATPGETALQLASNYNVFPLLMTDLFRDKVKGSMDWSPTEKLSLQFVAEGSRERYIAPTNRGAKEGGHRFFSVDSTYMVTDDWKLTGWFSHDDTAMWVHGAVNAYDEQVRVLNHDLGLGLRGSLTGKLEAGANMVFSYETNRWAQGVLGTTTQPLSIPAVAVRRNDLNFFMKYALEKYADLQVDYKHQSYSSNEWWWNASGTPFFYSDGTSVSQQASQVVNYIGMRYIYKFK